jgi:hypothetical protein
MLNSLNPPVVAEPYSTERAADKRPARAADVRTALRLSCITLGSMTIEGISRPKGKKTALVTRQSAGSRVTLRAVKAMTGSSSTKSGV